MAGGEERKIGGAGVEESVGWLGFVEVVGWVGWLGFVEVVGLVEMVGLVGDSTEVPRRGGERLAAPRRQQRPKVQRVPFSQCERQSRKVGSHRRHSAGSHSSAPLPSVHRSSAHLSEQHS